MPIIEYYRARWKSEAGFKDLKKIGSYRTQTRNPLVEYKYSGVKLVQCELLYWYG
jgi:hypothetical protein